MPVGTSARSPGSSRTSTVVLRSAPASPGWAYDGSGTAVDAGGPGSRRAPPARHLRPWPPPAHAGDPAVGESGRGHRPATPARPRRPGAAGCRARTPRRCGCRCAGGRSRRCSWRRCCWRSWSRCRAVACLVAAVVVRRADRARVPRPTAAPGSSWPTACSGPAAPSIPVQPRWPTRDRSDGEDDAAGRRRRGGRPGLPAAAPLHPRSGQGPGRRPGRPDAVLAGLHAAPAARGRATAASGGRRAGASVSGEGHRAD